MVLMEPTTGHLARLKLKNTPAASEGTAELPRHWNLALWTSLPLAQKKKNAMKIAEATSNQQAPLSRQKKGYVCMSVYVSDSKSKEQTSLTTASQVHTTDSFAMLLQQSVRHSCIPAMLEIGLRCYMQRAEHDKPGTHGDHTLGMAVL